MITRPGTVILTIGDTEVLVGRADVRPVGVEYDRSLFRPPYSDVWMTEGSGLSGPQAFEFSAEVSSSEGIAAAALRVAQLTSYLITATLVRTPIGALRSTGLQSLTVTPIVNGYRVDAVLGSADGLLTTDLFVYASPWVPTGVSAAWVAYLEGLGYSVDLYVSLEDNPPLVSYRAGLVLGLADDYEKATMATVAVPIMGNLASFVFSEGGSEVISDFSSAEITEGQEAHPITAGLAGLVGIFTAGQDTRALDDSFALSPGTVPYLTESVRIWAARGISARGYRRVGFPMHADPSAYHTDGAALLAAAIEWTIEGSSAVEVTLSATSAGTSVANMLGREATLLGNESVLLGAETITV